jgi:hypothetical protein
MSYQDLLKEYQSLPKNYQKEVEDFIAFLKSKLDNPTPKVDVPKKRILGVGQGKGWISPDFDEPLDEMKEYME